MLEIKDEKIKTRVCTCCGEEKQLTAEFFYKEKTAKDGFRMVCKDCTKSKYKNYKNENFDIYIWYQNKSNKFKSNWSFEDIKWIYNNYQDINKQILIDKFPNSNYKTIHNIISQWDIRKIEKNDDWSNNDIQFLKDNYPSMSQEKLQERFSYRTWDAIKNKASKLNLQRNDDALFRIRSESHKGFVVSEKTKRKQSRLHRGVNNHNWKGGLSPIHPYFREMLYEWKMDSLKIYNYKCAFTNENNNDLEIHHANENFSILILETFNILNLPIHSDMTIYNDEEIKLINKTFLELNYKSGLGVPLRKNIHKLFHVLYGLTNNNDKQFEEFKVRYFNNEFEEILKISDNDIKKKNKKNKKHKRLKSEEVIKIKELLNKGFPITYLSKEYGVGKCAIYNIKINKTWINVG